MKNINEAAIEYAEKCWNDTEWESDRHSTFEAVKYGIELAQRWIPVDEELPDFTAAVLCRQGEYVPFVGRYFDSTGFVFMDVSDGARYEITHWRPIELK